MTSHHKINLKGPVSIIPFLNFIFLLLLIQKRKYMEIKRSKKKYIKNSPILLSIIFPFCGSLIKKESEWRWVLFYLDLLQGNGIYYKGRKKIWWKHFCIRCIASQRSTSCLHKDVYWVFILKRVVHWCKA